MSTARISVLIACHNASRFIAETLQSIRRQTYTNFEVVVVDDGSTDNSVEVIERFTGENVRLVQQRNRGAACARNEAFRLSSGEYVLYIDADDVVGAEHFQSLINRAAEARGCIALSRWGRFRSAPSEAQFPNRQTERDLGGADWLELDWRTARPMTQSGMLLLPRVLQETNGGWDERLTLNDDFEFFARQISHCNGIRFAPDAQLYYRSSVPGSLSSQKSRAAVESAYLSADLGTRHLLAVKDTPDTRRICANLLQDFHYTHYPHHADLRAKARARVAELGGFDLQPDGSPAFQTLRRVTGWKAARLVERAWRRSRRRWPNNRQFSD